MIIFLRNSSEVPDVELSNTVHMITNNAFSAIMEDSPTSSKFKSFVFSGFKERILPDSKRETRVSKNVFLSNTRENSWSKKTSVLSSSELL